MNFPSFWKWNKKYKFSSLRPGKKIRNLNEIPNGKLFGSYAYVWSQYSWRKKSSYFWRKKIYALLNLNLKLNDVFKRISFIRVFASCNTPSTQSKFDMENIGRKLSCFSDTSSTGKFRSHCSRDKYDDLKLSIKTCQFTRSRLSAGSANFFEDRVLAMPCSTTFFLQFWI